MFDLNRFLKAQDSPSFWGQGSTYDAALSEIRRGRKDSHWMWFIFPILHDLGKSTTSVFYAIQSIEEAKAYLADPVLCARLVEISEAALQTESNRAEIVFGRPDDRKLRSCMTLFEQADPSIPVFGRVLEKFFDGKRDHLTLRILENDAKSKD